MWKLPSFWILVLGTFIALATFYIVINTISPILSPEIAFAAFYSVLFFAVAFSVGLFFSLIKKIISPTTSSYRCMIASLRQGFLFAALSVVALFFLQIEMFSWKEGFLLFLLGIFLELLLKERND